jgi:hypothetical protein
VSEKTVRCLCDKQGTKKSLKKFQMLSTFTKTRRGDLFKSSIWRRKSTGICTRSAGVHCTGNRQALIRGFGVVTFYSFFSTNPRGEHTIRVCLGTACYVRGGKKIIECLQDTLGIGLGETTKDGKFTLEVARCIGACGLAPAIMIDDVVYKQVNPNKLDGILSKY